MADGDHPGPKGLRFRILRLWRQAVRPAIDPPAPFSVKPRQPPKPHPHPRGLSRWKPPSLPVQPVMSEEARQAEQRKSYFERLKERVRDGKTDQPSLVRRDFDRQRD